MLKYKDFLSLDSNISENEKVEFEVSFVERFLPYSVCQKNINELSSRDTSRNNVLTEMANDKNTDNFIKKQFSYLIKSKVNTRMGNLKPSPFIHFLNEFRQGTKKASILNLLIFHNLRCHLKLINIFIFYIPHLLFQVLRRRHYCDLNISKNISFFLLTLYLSDIPPHLHH